MFTQDYDFIFYTTAWGKDELEEIKTKIDSTRNEHPFYVSYSGIAPSNLHMNPSYKVIFIKHKDGLRNNTAGLHEYLKALFKEWGFENRVGILNS